MAGIFDFLSQGQDQPGGGLLGRINNPLTLAGLGILSGSDAQSGWQQGMQGFQLGSKQQQEALKQALVRQALQQYAQGGNINPLLLSGDPQLMQTALQLQQQKATEGRDTRDFAFRQQEAQRAQQNADRSHGLQSQTAGRSDPVQRAKTAEQFGLQKGTPEWKSYVLNGELPAGNSTVADQTAQRKLAAADLGIKPDDPIYNSYVLTGKTPREDAQPLTATDKKAIAEADEAVLANRSAIESLGRAQELSPKAFSGLAAGPRGYAASFLGPDSDIGKGGIATENLTNEVMTNALSQLKPIFGGNPTEGERGILLEIQGSVNKPDAVRQDIYKRAQALAQKRLEFNQQKADQLRGKTYYKPQGAQSQATGPTTEIPQGAIAALKANPALKADFEAKYGPGSAAVAMR